MTLDKFLRYVIFTGIFLLPVVPLIVANSLFFPFITGKNFFFRIVVEIVAAAWLLLVLRDPAYRPRFSGILISLATFIGIIGLANVLGEDPFKSFWSNFERMEGYISLLHVSLYVFVAGCTLATERLWGRLAHTSVGVSVLVGFYGLLQIWDVFAIHQGSTRIDATLGNAAYLASYMLIHIFITALLLARWRGGNVMRGMYVLIILLQSIILFYTATRGAMLALIGGAILTAFLIALFERSNIRLRYTAAGVMTVFVLMVGSFLVLKESSFIQGHPILSRLATINLDAGETRLTIWGMAWEGFKEKPILGWGQENFNLVFNKYYQPELYTQEPWFDHVHNIVLDWLVAGGFLGALAYFLIPIIALYYIWRPASRNTFSVAERSILTGWLAAYFFQNLFVFDNVITHLAYGSLLAYIYAQTKPQLSAASIAARNFNTASLTRVAAPLVIVLLIGALYFFNGRGIATASYMIKGLQADASNPSDPTAAIEDFKKAASYNIVGSQELAEQLGFLTQQVAMRQNVPLESKQRLAMLAVDEMQEELERAPGDARLRVFMGTLLSRLGLHEQGALEMKKALELSPQKPAIMLELGLALLNTGKYQEALGYLERAHQLAPTLIDAHIFYAMGAIYAGDLKLAEEILNDKSEVAMDLKLDDRILNAYVANNYLSQARELLSLRLERNPNNADTMLGAAVYYYRWGERDTAIALIEKAIELRPELKAEGEAIINGIKSGEQVTN